MKQHQKYLLVGAISFLLGVAFTYYMLSFSVSIKTDQSYNIGFEQGFEVGERSGYDKYYEEINHNIDSLNNKLKKIITTLKE